ncbi:MAG: hypothetical protein WCK05_12355 [Planctomycetota bacterium]
MSKSKTSEIISPRAEGVSSTDETISRVALVDKNGTLLRYIVGQAPGQSSTNSPTSDKEVPKPESHTESSEERIWSVGMDLDDGTLLRYTPAGCSLSGASLRGRIPSMEKVEELKCGKCGAVFLQKTHEDGRTFVICSRCGGMGFFHSGPWHQSGRYFGWMLTTSMSVGALYLVGAFWSLAFGTSAGAVERFKIAGLLILVPLAIYGVMRAVLHLIAKKSN